MDQFYRKELNFFLDKTMPDLVTKCETLTNNFKYFNQVLDPAFEVVDNLKEHRWRVLNCGENTYWMIT